MKASIFLIYCSDEDSGADGSVLETTGRNVQERSVDRDDDDEAGPSRPPDDDHYK